MLNVAHIMGKMVSGGVESMIMNYYRHIDRTKVQFCFIIDEDSTVVPYDEIENLGGKVFKIPPYQKPIAYHKALYSLLSEGQYDIVHSHINTLSVFPLFAAKRAGMPIRIAHSHSTAGKGEATKNVLKYLLRPFSKIFPTHYFACSEYAGRWLFGDKLYNTGKVRLINNAIDLSKFKFDPQVRKSLRAELNINDKLVIGHIGRFTRQKNHSFLIDIFEQIHMQDSTSMLLLVGEGELEQEIRDKVKRLKLADCVFFLGIRDDVHRLLSAMDIFLLPSLYEGLPVVGIEAQANGLKMIASDTVTKEAKMSESFTYMPLAQSAEEWATKALEVSELHIDRESAIDQIVSSGYEIKTAAAELCEIYVSISI